MTSQEAIAAELAERIISEFEQAWLSESPPSIAKFVTESPISGTSSAQLLAELCVVDMEFRWQQEATAPSLQDDLGPRPRLRDYEKSLSLVPQLQFDVSCIVEEYRVRSLWGDMPTPDQFLSEFPQPSPTLLQAIKEVDQELSNDDVGIDHFAAVNRIAAENDPRAPLPFSDYILHELLGTGGIGKVYRATQLSLERSVAVKTLAKSLQRDPIAVDRFVDEARTLARLSHPNIVGVHGLGQYPGGGYFLVMDFVKGTTLDELQMSHPLSRSESIEVVRRLAETIDYAHGKGVIHCDLKPSNILIADDNSLFVSDFGFAELWHDVRQNLSNDIERRGGTFGFTAPEWLEDATVQPAPTIDVYSLGAVLAKLTEDVTASDDPLGKVCNTAMSRLPGDRFQTAREFRQALE